MNNMVKNILKLIGTMLFFCIVKNVLPFIFGTKMEWVKFFIENYWVFVGLGLIPAFIAEIKGHPFFLFWIMGTFAPILSTISTLGLADNREQENDQGVIEPIMICFKGRIINHKDESIEGAKISIKENGLSCMSDTCGKFSIIMQSTESAGMSYWIKITKEGYESLFYHYITKQDEIYNFKLKSINE